MSQFTLHKVTAYTDNWKQPNVTEYWILDADGEKVAELYDESLANMTRDALNFCFDEGLVVENEQPVAYLDEYEYQNEAAAYADSI